MAVITLFAENEGQRRVLEYLRENASDALAEKINTGKKTMQGCWTYITSMARNKSQGNVAVIEDQEVFGWAVHFFEEDSIPESGHIENARKTVTKEVHKEYLKKLEAQHEEMLKKEVKVVKKPEKSNDITGQISLFDLMEG